MADPLRDVVPRSRSEALKPERAALLGRGEKVAVASAHATMAAAVTPETTVVAAAPTPAAISHDGSAAYHVPQEMVEAKASFVDLWIDRNAPAATLAGELAQHLQLTADRVKQRSGGALAAASGPPVIGEVTARSGIKVGDVMVAQLRGGEDFNIDPKEPLSQSLKDEDRLKWLWRVTPKRSSEEGLELVLEVWINPGANQRMIESIREVVIVKARPRTWYEIFQEFDKWLALLGAGGIGGLIVAIRKWLQKRRQAATDAPPQPST